MVDLRKIYARVEDELKMLERSYSDDLPVDDREQVREFIDAGEYGLALELYVHAYREAGIQPPDQATAAIHRAAGEMGVSLP